MIEIRSLTASYGGENVLENCSLSVPRGGHIALMGPSGCGKTTLLRCIAGLELPKAGSVSAEGRIAAVFQEPRLLPWLTAEENISVVIGKGRTGAHSALWWLERAGLADSAGKYPRELSGGMQQRISICRALHYGGDILLLDEPFKGLDEKRKDEMTDLISEFSKGQTLVLVTHDNRDAERLAGTIYDFSDKTFLPRA